MSFFNIAIDGPAGAGKSTIAKKVAAQLGFIYVDTGAMYRAMALYLTRNGLSPEQPGLKERIEDLCGGAEISIEYRDGEQVVLLNGENVNSLLRTEAVSAMASVSSAVPEVRVRLVALQQKLAAQCDVVMDGRDIGTVVLPNAQVKVYLTASAEVRAQRRYKENLAAAKAGAQKSAEDLDPEKIRQDIEERDRRDMTRETSPLRQAEDAVLVDSSDMTIDRVAETILNLAAAALGRPKVYTAPSAGFCFGVEHAVDAVYQEIARRDAADGACAQAEDAAASEILMPDLPDGGRAPAPINTFGPIIHNETVVEELQRKGVGIIHTVEEARQQGGTVIIRSHGVSKEAFDALEASGVRVVDTTCPFVKKIHEIVYRESRAGKQIVIIGNHGHAETEGTVGWCVPPEETAGTAAMEAGADGESPQNAGQIGKWTTASGAAHDAAKRSNVTVIETEEEARCFDIDRSIPVCVVAQTTFHVSKFEKFVALLKSNGYNIDSNETICSATDERQTQARRLARQADVMIVIGSRGSSNTARLCEI